MFDENEYTEFGIDADLMDAIHNTVYGIDDPRIKNSNTLIFWESGKLHSLYLWGVAGEAFLRRICPPWVSIKYV